MSLVEAATKLPDQRAIPLRDVRATMAAIEAGRIDAGLSAEALARLAGMTRQSYQRYASGARRPGGSPPCPSRPIVTRMASRCASGASSTLSSASASGPGRQAGPRSSGTARVPTRC